MDKPVHPQQPSGEAASSAPSSSTPHHRQYLRTTVQSVINTGKNSNRVVQYAIEAVEKSVSPVCDKWDPLLYALDDQIESVVSAVRNVSLSDPITLNNNNNNNSPSLNAAVPSAAPSPDMHSPRHHSADEDLSVGSSDDDDDALEQEEGGSILDSQSVHQNEDHWNQLRENFMRSSWFRQVDQIMSENFVLNPLLAVASPAQVFFNTAMDVYLQTSRFPEFLVALKNRLGSAWDDRLTQPASVFFSTARTVTSIVGVSRFINGAMHLTKSTINSALSQIFYRWDQILGLTDDCLDYFLPERELDEGIVESKVDNDSNNNNAAMRSSPAPAAFVDPLSEDDVKAEVVRGPEQCLQDADQYELESGGSEESNSKKRRRSMVGIASKVTRRVKQRIPSLQSITLQIKTKLFSSSWFKTVDEILMQNVLMQSLGTLVRPAEHFYETSLNIFVEKRRSLDEFLLALRIRLGAAWDDRLTGPAMEFYESATEASDTEFDE